MRLGHGEEWAVGAGMVWGSIEPAKRKKKEQTRPINSGIVRSPSEGWQFISALTWEGNEDVLNGNL